MAEAVRVKNIGLRGVTVADTKISFIDGGKGVLIYRGFRIEDLAAHSNFLETAHLLLLGHLPSPGEAAVFTEAVTAAREIPGYVPEAFKLLPKDAVPMDVFQGAVPLLATADPELHDDSREANVRMAARLLARFPTMVAAWHRVREGLSPVAPDPALPHAANFLYMLTGERPDPEIARDLDTCLLLHADHTFNASTFACREVVSTRAHMYAGVSAGVGALSGALHGGANAQVMRMLGGLEGVSDIPAWVQAELAAGRRIMGMGHAVYKTMDPRAKILKEMSARLGKKLGREEWFQRSTAVEEAAIREFDARGKPEIRPNVDFYSASVYHVMGIPADLMTPVFAISRVAGWCAHIIEEKFGEAQGKPALYRPQAEYVGDYCGLMGCEWQPPETRK